MNAMNISQKQFREMMEQGQILLVDYWAPWCSYCKRIGPAYDWIAEAYKDQLAVVKINIDEEEDLAREEKIDVIPTLVIYRGGMALSSVVAPGSMAEIDAFIKRTLSK